VAAVVSIALAILYRFSPTEYSFYPVCPFAYWTHLQCPGCGSTRALYSLLHGQVVDAMRFNAMFCILFLLAVCFGMAQYWSAVRNDRFVRFTTPPPLVRVVAVSVFAFGFIRNIPKLGVF
jgi:hypothetical protein